MSQGTNICFLLRTRQQHNNNSSDNTYDGGNRGAICKSTGRGGAGAWLLLKRSSFQYRDNRAYLCPEKNRSTYLSVQQYDFLRSCCTACADSQEGRTVDFESTNVLYYCVSNHLLLGNAALSNTYRTLFTATSLATYRQHRIPLRVACAGHQKYLGRSRESRQSHRRCMQR